MWEPVEVHEWLEDVWLPRQQTERVWCMQVRFLDRPSRPPTQTACCLYAWDPGQRVFPWGDEGLIVRSRQIFWQQYEETGAFPVSTHHF